MNKIQYAPPRHDELEISLFGPGIGECIASHIADNQWIIVDSCIDPSVKESAPLVYLRQLGVDPSESVKLFIISHWHSDHIRGASQIANACPKATICFSEALSKKEFLTLVSCYSGLEHPIVLDRETCGVREISSIIRTIKARCEKHRFARFQPFNLASADKRIYQVTHDALTREVWSLSPSPSAIVNSLTEIGSLIPTPSKDAIRGVIPIPTKNHNAIVILIKCGESTNVLLGSDLEETTDPSTGWSVIVNSPNRPQGKSKIFKIPHHGSQNGHSHRVWREMIESEEAIGILTSKIGGRAPIPKNSDIKRLKKYTSNLYGTLEPLVKPQKRDRTVEKTIKGVAKKRIPFNGSIGQIQIRIDPHSNIQIGVKSPAKKF